MRVYLVFCGFVGLIVFGYFLEIGFAKNFFNYLPAEMGGETSRKENNRLAFSQPAGNISKKRMRDFFFGNSLFNTSWTTFPGSVKTLDGLGLLFNRSSCSGCHLRDGRGRPSLPGETKLLSILFRTYLLTEGAGMRPHPRYGSQLQNQSIVGVVSEGSVETFWKVKAGKFGDGEVYRLRYPAYHLRNLKYVDAMLPQVSARVAPAVIGLGLLGAIQEDEILRFSDPEDKNQDGISGRSVYVYDELGQKKIGRFGWKANVPTVRKQIAVAAMNDMGLSNPLFSEECSESQEDCLASPRSRNLDLSQLQLDKITTYASLLGVPRRRGVLRSRVREGERLFSKINCNQCHRTTYRTSNDPRYFSELRNQLIHPFTDLLLHDLGEGLDENSKESYREDNLSNRISSREWRTPPLWGVGLVPVVNQHSFYLHDGRARNLEEAILWHGGEAQGSKKDYLNLAKPQREALVEFLKSL